MCRVIGTLVSTCKIPDYEGFKILAVRQVDTDGKMYGDTIQAVDCAQAGIGDYVLMIEEGGSCTQVMSELKSVTPMGDRLAVNKALIAVIDYIEADGDLVRFDHLSVERCEGNG